VDQLYKAYIETQEKYGKRIVAKPGDTIPIKGLTVQVLSAGGSQIPAPVTGAGQPNPLCAGFQAQDGDGIEDAHSLGTLITFGEFRILDLGDLTWNKKHDLVCPNNKIGMVDVYLAADHGLHPIGPLCVMNVLRPRVIVMSNGPRTGSEPEAWQALNQSAGVQDIWQLHYSVAGGKANNAPDSYIANPNERCEGKWIRLSAQPDGTFTVTNGRNIYSRNYDAN
jgi:signal peptidase I